MINTNIDDSIPLPTGPVFREYCHNNPSYARSIIDGLFNPQTSLPNTIDQHISLLKSYIAAGQSFDDFCQQSIHLFLFSIFEVLMMEFFSKKVW